MPIVITTPPVPDFTVQDVIDGVSQDIRNQLSATLVGKQQDSLIDWTNRTCQEMLRWSNWSFMESNVFYFMTVKGQTNYWIGPTGTGPSNTIDTGLNFTDLYKVAKDSVRDMSNFRQLKWLKEAPIGPTLTYTSGMSRPGQPAAWRQDGDTPNLFQIYPAPDNQNTTQPVPAPPFITQTPGGSLSGRIYFIKITLVDELGGESSASTANQNFLVRTNNLCTVASPQLLFPGTSDGILYSSYNVYAQAVTPTAYQTNQSDPGGETLQNVTPIPIGTNWTEPISGLTTTGALWPQNNSLAQLGGYIIALRYFKARTILTAVDDPVQVDEKYKDIIIHGVNRYAWPLLGRPDMAKEADSKFIDGYRQMVVDKNLTPEGVEFVRPDAGSYVNSQILGYLPPFF